MFKKIRGAFSSDLSIDLGTANTLVYVRGKGIILNEPSVVAIRYTSESRKVVAVGKEAKAMLGRTPANVKAIRPLKDGVIADFDVCEQMLKRFIAKAHESHNLIKPSPRVVICVPCQATKVEQKAIRESALEAGARMVKLIEEPMAAAIGAGMPVEEARGSMVVDIGGGTTEIAVLSLNGVVYSRSLKVGGDMFDEKIVEHVKRTHGIQIGIATAERIKKEVAMAHPECEAYEIDVRGFHVAEGVPRTVTVDSHEIYTAIKPALDEIVNVVLTALENTPAELASDIAERGFVLTGGGALLRGIEKLLSEETEVPATVAEDPLTCVVRGGGKALEMMDRYPQDLIYSDQEMDLT
jgi:rod shape-determining protein MreB